MFSNMPFKKQLRYIDKSLIAVTLLIVTFSILNVYSATHMTSGLSFAKLQALWVLLGIIIILTISFLDYSFVKAYAEVVYWASIALLMFNDITSRAVKGASSWIKIGSRAIEPSEFVKIGLVLILSKKIEDMEGDINEPKNLLKLTAYVIIPMFLIVIQPNLGMTLICFFTALGIFYIAGLNMKVIYTGIIAAIPLSLIVWFSGILKTYQKNRIISFLNPEMYQQDIAFQLMQGMIGIGSGGVLGKGFLNGTQVAGGYIPEVHTDFIFAAVGEEWGLVGAIALLIMYGFLIYRMLKIAKESQSIMSRCLCVGVAAALLFSILQNIGMTIGIMPIAGITLPLMSYGGSSMLANFISIGLVINMGKNKNKINF